MKISAKCLLKEYSKISWKHKLHIFLRVKTVPWERILNNFPRANSIIDIGCGHGVLLNFLSIHNCGYKRLDGVDLAAEKINVAKLTSSEKISFQVIDIFDFNKEADVYSIFDVLYLFNRNQQECLIKYVYDKLADNGYFVIKEMDNKPIWKFFINVIQETIAVKLMHLTLGDKFHFNSEAVLTSLLKAVGFEVTVKRIHKGYLHPHILYVCQKKAAKAKYNLVVGGQHKDEIVCNICKSKKVKKIFEPGDYSVFKCMDCNVDFNADFPLKLSSEESFSKEYYFDVQKEAFEKQAKNYAQDPSLVIYKKGLCEIEKLTSDRRLLDVGAGLGAFMKFASDSGWIVEGVEISPFASEFIREKYGFNVSSKDLLSAGYRDSSFGAVTFWDSIEHMELPKENLKKAYDLLKQGGILLITTDNFNSLICYVAKILYFLGFGRFKYHMKRVFLPYNKHYFTNAYMCRLIKEMSFQISIFQKIQYPISKLKLNIIEKVAVYLLYKLEIILNLQSQFMVIARKI